MFIKFPNIFPSPDNSQNDKGQTFLEFLLIMMIMISMSFIMLKGFNSGVGTRWVSLVKIIAKPTTSNIVLN